MLIGIWKTSFCIKDITLSEYYSIVAKLTSYGCNAKYQNFRVIVTGQPDKLWRTLYELSYYYDIEII